MLRIKNALEVMSSLTVFIVVNVQVRDSLDKYTHTPSVHTYTRTKR